MNETSELNRPMKLPAVLAAMVLLAAAMCAALAPAQTPPAPKDANAREGASEESKMEYRANAMINNGVELLESKQVERGMKLIQSVPEMFPRSQARFKAYLLIAKEYSKTRQFELAIKQLAHLSESETPDEQAEGLYQTGICYYDLGSYDKAFTALRRVTNDYPWSVFANEAYYYIGQCHFSMKRWAKAIEALEMVGTSVPADANGTTLAEAGQRLYFKVHDKDLVVLKNENEKLAVSVVAKSGDRKTVTLEPLGKSGEFYIGSIMTVLGEPKPGDGILFITGRDEVTVEYNDHNTESGKTNVKRLATVRMVSTATAGFTDGAYREYTKGVFADRDAFIRVKDLNYSVGNERNTIKARVYTQYKQEKDEDANAGNAGKTGVELDEQPEYVKRKQVEVTLTETAPHTGIFAGTIAPHLVADANSADLAGASLVAMKGDEVVVEYVNDAHIGGGDPRIVTAKAKLLIGEPQDVKVTYHKVDDPDLKARKNLIEAQIYLKLGQIFKDVGLTNKANEKAAEGLDRVQDVINTSVKASLDRSLVEEAFSVKWDLLLVQDKLEEAISVCHALTRLFPDSSLVDKALLKIGMAKAMSDTPGDAIGILSAVTQLPKSDLKAEAQYNIGVVLKKIAEKDATVGNHAPVYSQAMVAFKSCADNYPTSSFAGDALGEIADFYVSTKDYPRAVEFMERVFTDYPDASFLDKMLLKWGVVAHRLGDDVAARQKFQELLSEYPQSAQAERARSYLATIDKKEK
jgi:TolA-binding protein